MKIIAPELARTNVDRAGPRILVNSLPKSGTHLLASILNLVPGLKLQKPALIRDLQWHPVNCLRLWDQVTCLVGIGQPRKVRLSTLSFILSRLGNNRYMIGHIPYQECVSELLQSLGIRTFFVMRDPRDVVVSQVHYFLKRKSHYLHLDYKKLGTDKERLITAILGVRRRSGDLKSRGIAEKLQSTLGWAEAKSVLVLRFEELVGERGGGNSEDQKRAIMRVGSHIGIEISAKEALFIGDEMFGKGDTFRQGKIGSWQDVFDQETKEIFKRTAGEYLIKMGYEENYNW